MMLLAEIFNAQVELLKAYAVILKMSPSPTRGQLTEKAGQLWTELETQKKNNMEV